MGLKLCGIRENEVIFLLVNLILWLVKLESAKVRADVSMEQSKIHFLNSRGCFYLFYFMFFCAVVLILRKL